MRHLISSISEEMSENFYAKIRIRDLGKPQTIYCLEACIFAQLALQGSNTTR